MQKRPMGRFFFFCKKGVLVGILSKSSTILVELGVWGDIKSLCSL